jgi:diguanylate cyclase (GGDEF)-like protein
MKGRRRRRQKQPITYLMADGPRREPEPEEAPPPEPPAVEEPPVPAATAPEVTPERELIDVLADAAIEMPWPEDAIEQLLVEWCSHAVDATISVEIVPAPPPDASFVFGDGRYLVARRPFGSAIFSSLDHRVLTALATMATASKHAARRDEHLRRRALTDDLTGLWQHGFFRELVEDVMIERHSEYLGVLFLDIDRFKELNEQFGHLEADEVLREVGARLRYGPFPEGSIAARMGGDERKVEGQEHLDGIVEELTRLLRAPIPVGDLMLSIDVSIGAQLSISAADDPELLLRSAERRMRDNKRSRPGQRPPRWYDESTLLREMLDEGRVRVAFQPIVDLRSGAIHGYEALVRGQHLEVGQVSPLLLVGSASKLRMLDELTEVVLDSALATMRAVERLASAPVALSINLEFEQLRSGSYLLETLPQRLEGTDVHLVLEISERHVARWTPSQRILATELADAGIGFAVDDFGVGYSALGLLNSWPWEWVKLDRSLVAEGGGEAGRTLLGHVSHMLDDLSLTPVAEGIETAQELGYARSIGVGLGQGTLLAPPAPAADVLAAVTEHGLCLPHLEPHPDHEG